MPDSSRSRAVTDHILDVDLLAFERGSDQQRAAVVDGVRRSLASRFVFTSHDLPSDLLDTAYGMLAELFALPDDAKARSTVPDSHAQTGYAGLLVETAATAEVADWKEMLNWGAPLPEGHPLRRRYPHRYLDPVLPDGDVAGITATLLDLHRHTADLQRRFLRIVAVALGAHETLFDACTTDGPDLSRAIHYPAMDLAPGAGTGDDDGQVANAGEAAKAGRAANVGHVWAAEHSDINLITALPRATAKGLEVKTDDGWIDATPPHDHVVINTGIMLDHVSNGLMPAGVHRVVADATDPDPGDRISVVQFCHPTPWTVLAPLASCCTPDNPPATPAHRGGRGARPGPLGDQPARLSGRAGGRAGLPPRGGGTLDPAPTGPARSITSPGLRARAPCGPRCGWGPSGRPAVRP
jgi:isopenicillin N synthase-like dioxygenase